METANPTPQVIPQDMLRVFMEKFMPCPPGEEPDEQLTTTEFFAIFLEHAGELNPEGIRADLSAQGFTATLDAGRMVFLWNLKLRRLATGGRLDYDTLTEGFMETHHKYLENRLRRFLSQLDDDMQKATDNDRPELAKYFEGVYHMIDKHRYSVARGLDLSFRERRAILDILKEATDTANQELGAT